MGVYEVGGVNVLVDECTPEANFLCLNQEKSDLISLKICSFAHYTLEEWILTF